MTKLIEPNRALCQIKYDPKEMKCINEPKKKERI